MGGAFEMYKVYIPWIGSLMILVWTFLAPMIHDLSWWVKIPSFSRDYLKSTMFSLNWRTIVFYDKNDTISFSVKVKNTGKMDGEEVVQAYIQYPRGKGLPINEMRQFYRILISQNGEQYIAFKIPVSAFQKWDENQNGMKVYKGEYHLSVGANAADRKLVYAFKIE